MAQSSTNLLLYARRFLTRFFPSYALLSRECEVIGRFLEKDYFPRASAQEFERVEWQILPDTATFHVFEGPKTQNIPPARRLIKFLDSVGLKKVSLDVRLESNQVVDIFMALYGMKRYLKLRNPLKVKEFVRGIYAEDGLKMYCAQVGILSDLQTLCVNYSYCELTFSKAVTAFKRRNQLFRDHRSFFYAAPRYGLLITFTLVILPLLLHLFLPGYEIFILSFVGCFVGVLTYLLFQTIGSIEYDKEEQAQEIRKAHRTLQEKQWMIDQDLEKAAQIQKQILPAEYFRTSGYEIAALLKPQSQIGGDFYDFWETPEGHLIIMMVDSVGHGLFSALIATAIKSVSLNNQGRVIKPEDFISLIELVMERILPMGFFAALTYLDLNPKESKASLINAGNPFPILIRANGAQECIKQANSIPLGIPVQSQYYQPWEFDFKKGEKIVFYTDGIVESRNAKGADYTEERLRDLISENVHLNAKELRNLIFQNVATFLNGEPQSDDQTLIIIHST